MDLNTRKWMIISLVMWLVNTGLTGWMVVVLIDARMPPLFPFLFFLASVSFFVLAGAVAIDLITNKEKLVEGKIVSVEGRIVHVLTEGKKLKRFRISNRTVRERLEAGQHIRLTLVKWTNWPTRIEFGD